MLVNIACVDGDGALAFTDDFLQLLVLLGQSLDVPIDHSESIFEVVDLIVEHFVMGVNRNLGINKRVHTSCHIVEVLGVQLFKLLHEDLRRRGRLTPHVLLLILRLLLLHLLLIALSDLLVAPGALIHGLLLCHTRRIWWLHQERGASLSNGLDQRIVSSPLLNRAGFEHHSLLVNVWQLHQSTLLHLHIKVDPWRRQWIVLRQNNLQWVSRRGGTLENQIVALRFSREIYRQKKKTM